MFIPKKLKETSYHNGVQVGRSKQKKSKQTFFEHFCFERYFLLIPLLFMRQIYGRMQRAFPNLTLASDSIPGFSDKGDCID